MKEKISLIKLSAYFIVLYIVLILSELYDILKNLYPTKPIFVGTVYLPLLISHLKLVLIVVVGYMAYSRYINSDKWDELAKMHMYKAGYYAKYIFLILLILLVILVKDFSFLFEKDMVGGILSAIVLGFCFSDMLMHIVFIILEKTNVE